MSRRNPLDEISASSQELFAKIIPIEVGRFSISPIHISKPDIEITGVLTVDANPSAKSALVMGNPHILAMERDKIHGVHGTIVHPDKFGREMAM